MTPEALHEIETRCGEAFFLTRHADCYNDREALLREVRRLQEENAVARLAVGLERERVKELEGALALEKRLVERMESYMGRDNRNSLAEDLKCGGNDADDFILNGDPKALSRAETRAAVLPMANRKHLENPNG